uniref:Uncharacterized protein n=1 Tax=Quercus lobata TaxID=97700 RepID=A0A7N2KUW5_QUELO
MSVVEPAKMSSYVASDFVDNLANGSALEVLPTVGDGVWRVKLVIDTKQLEEILSKQVNTKALIEKMRMVASSASITPKRTESAWGMSWKPTLLNLFKLPLDNGKQKPMANDSTSVIGVSNLVAGDALVTIDVGSSMVRDTSPTTSDQKHDPATSVGVLVLSQVTYNTLPPRWLITTTMTAITTTIKMRKNLLIIRRKRSTTSIAST